MFNFNSKFQLNAIKSSFDNRDYIYKNTDVLPKTLDYRPTLMPIRNQGAQGTCYAQSAACMKEWQEKMDYGFSEYFSPQFFYNNRDYWNNNKKDGEDSNEDYGMTGRDVMRILKNVGICKENDYPYGMIETADKISDNIKIEAKKHCIKKYARINDINSLKSSLYYNGPCLIAFPVYNMGKEMWKQKNGEDMNGGHAMTVVGYTEDSFIIRNSWGWYWNFGGHCYYKFEDWGAHWEIWTTVDEDTIVEIEEEKVQESSDSESDFEQNKTEDKEKSPDETTNDKEQKDDEEKVEESSDSDSDIGTLDIFDSLSDSDSDTDDEEYTCLGKILKRLYTI
tara:strand:+ start:12036 stop:13043 length:1008 start_codon:yes stop_codon:yes gene_type:complete